MFGKTVAVASAAIIAFSASTDSASAAVSPLVLEVSRCPAVMLRQQKDPRIKLKEESAGKEQVVQMLLSAQGSAYTISLGWFTAARKGAEIVCTDEMGQTLPLPGENATRLDKACWHEIRGFDLISDGKPRAALKEFEEAVRQPAGNARLYNNLGACLAMLGQYDAARKQLDLACKMKPDLSIALANQAWLALDGGNCEEALAQSRKALQLDADLLAARQAAVQAQLKLKLYDGAFAVSEDTLKRWPGDWRAVLLSGDALAAKGDFRAARNRYQKVLLLLPNDADVLLKLASASAQLGDLDDALKRSRQAAVLAPESADGHLALGRYLEMNREERAAQVQLERTLELDPPLAVKEATFGPLLRVLATLNKLDEADKLSRKWAQAYANSASCHYNRAWVASQLKGTDRASEAIQEYRKALALDKSLVSAHYNLALLLVKQGQSNEACQELERFIKLAPLDPDLPNARKLLAQISK